VRDTYGRAARLTIRSVGRWLPFERGRASGWVVLDDGVEGGSADGLRRAG